MNIFVVVIYNYYSTTRCISSHRTRKEAIEACVKYHEADLDRKRMFSSEPESNFGNISAIKETLTKFGSQTFYHDELDRQDRWGTKYQRLYKIYFVKEIKGYISDKFILMVQDKQQPMNLECFACPTREKAVELTSKKLNKPSSQKIKNRFTGNYYTKGGVNFFIENINV